MIGSCGLGCDGLSGTAANATYAAITTSGMVVAAACAVCAPVVGLVIAAAAIAKALNVGEGCGPTCIQATNIVNQAEPIFRQNVAEYESGGIDQATAVSNWTQMWSAIQQACGGIPGAAGSKCVSDRAVGSCKYKQTAAPKYPGEPQLGECWNWDAAYHQPLLQPALVAFSGGGVNGSLNSVVSSLTSNPMLLIGAGLLVVGLMSKGDR